MLENLVINLRKRSHDVRERRTKRREKHLYNLKAKAIDGTKFTAIDTLLLMHYTVLGARSMDTR